MTKPSYISQTLAAAIQTLEEGGWKVIAREKTNTGTRYVVEIEAVKSPIPKATALSLREMEEAARAGLTLPRSPL